MAIISTMQKKKTKEMYYKIDLTLVRNLLKSIVMYSTKVIIVKKKMFKTNVHFLQIKFGRWGKKYKSAFFNMVNNNLILFRKYNLQSYLDWGHLHVK